MFTPTPNTATGADHARANADIDRLNAAKRAAKELLNEALADVAKKNA